MNSKITEYKVRKNYTAMNRNQEAKIFKDGKKNKYMDISEDKLSEWQICMNMDMQWKPQKSHS